MKKMILNLIHEKIDNTEGLSLKLALKFTYNMIKESFENYSDTNSIFFTSYKRLMLNGFDSDKFIKQFSEIFKAKNIKDICSLYIEVFFNYLEPQRFYHNLNHIQFLLENLDTKINFFKGFDTKAINIIKVAIIFHDYVYKIGANDNEYYSSIIAKNLLYELSYDKTFVLHVERCILSTWYSNSNYKPETAFEKLVVDLDLLGFGLDFQTYLKNTCNVIAESIQIEESKLLDLFSLYNITLNSDSFITEEFFISFLKSFTNIDLLNKRINFLNTLLTKENIYNTPHCQFSYNHIAKSNILNEIKYLNQVLSIFEQVTQ